MGVFSSNRSQLGMYSGDEIVANENYNGMEGAMQIVIENHANDQMFFESLISEDFKDAYMIHEGYELEPITEANVSGVVDKIKQFINKIWAKIKGLYQVAIDKIGGVITRDNKSFVDKYKNKVMSNTNLGKMKYKWADPKSSDAPASNVNKLVTEVLDQVQNSSDLDGLADKISDGDFTDNILSTITGIKTDSKSLNKDMKEHYFDSESQEEGLKNERLNSIISVLQTGGKEIEKLKRGKSNADTFFSKLLGRIDRARTDLIKADGDTDGSAKFNRNKENDTEYGVSYSAGKKDVAMKKLNLMYSSISHTGSAFARVTGIYIDLCKFEIKQARRVFAQAVTYKALKEEALLVEAVGESAEWEIDSLFESYEM